jgi:hypothetical protein
MKNDKAGALMLLQHIQQLTHGELQFTVSAMMKEFRLSFKLVSDGLVWLRKNGYIEYLDDKQKTHIKLLKRVPDYAYVRRSTNLAPLYRMALVKIADTSEALFAELNWEKRWVIADLDSASTYKNLMKQLNVRTMSLTPMLFTPQTLTTPLKADIREDKVTRSEKHEEITIVGVENLPETTSEDKKQLLLAKVKEVLTVKDFPKGSTLGISQLDNGWVVVTLD